MTAAAVLDLLRETWAPVAARFAAYDLLLPGTPSFDCLASSCPAHCCRVFSVALGEPEAERLASTHGLAHNFFLESEDGEPIALPLAEPYLLARRDGQCVLLRDDLLCGAYAGRPNACRLYPHQLLVIDPGARRPAGATPERVAEATGALLAGDATAPVLRERVPVLLQHRSCPGFRGPEHTGATWRALYAETCELQFGIAPAAAMERVR
jgi:Fe-S-cluster containining protein